MMALQVPFTSEKPVLQLVQVPAVVLVQTKQFVSLQIGLHSPRTKLKPLTQPVQAVREVQVEQFATEF